jgi:hypothetical protein
MKHTYWLLLAALAAGAAVAQSGARPDPADPNARVPETAYRSAFEGYRNHELSRQTPWRDANEAVGRVGGHVGILREQAAREKDASGKGEKGTSGQPGDKDAPGGRK